MQQANHFMRYVAILLIALLSSPVIASAPAEQVHCVQPRLKDGIYLGAGLGYDAYRIRESVSVRDVTGVLDQANSTANPRGLVGQIFAGYGRYFDWFYIAGELMANYSDASASYSLNNYHNNVTIRESYGASILPGVLIKNVALVFFRVGYVRTFLKAQENMPTLFNDTTTHWGNGLGLGLGLEMLAYQAWSVRGEYRYANYSFFKSQVGTSFTPSDNQLVVSAIYHIDYL